MMEKFEIKSHDGPGRIGKLNGEKTPKLFYKDELKIAPSEGSPFWTAWPSLREGWRSARSI